MAKARLKYEKAPRPDGKHGDMLKLKGSEQLTPMIIRLNNIY